MSNRSRAAFGIWGARTSRSGGDRAFLVYAILMVGLVAVGPLARVVWMGATSSAGVSAFASPIAPGVTAFVVAALWASALLLGRDRGPALLPPFLNHALAASDLPRTRVFGGSMLRGGAFVTTVTTMGAALVALSLLSHGLTDPLSAVIFIGMGALTGAIATVAWLAGQAFPKAAILIALCVLALGALTAVFPALELVFPWGWVGLAFPGAGSLHAVAPMIAFAAASLSIVPLLLSRLAMAGLIAQAARWETASAHATSLDLGAAAASYQHRPHLGRRMRAIRALGSLSVIFLIRDAVGAIRTPGRFIVGSLAIAAGGALVALALLTAAPVWLLGAAAGLLVFGGMGPLTDGVRHAASVASDFSLYGIRDEHLLVNHALFPLTAVLVMLVVAVIVCSLIIGIGVAGPVISATALGVLAVIHRVSSALKGSMPTALLTPVPSAMGDLAAAARLVWALDGLLLASLVGAGAVLAFENPIVLACATALVVGILVTRWHHRR